MTTYNTGNPIGSTAAKDLYDNAQNLDNLLLGPLDYYPDRLNVERISYRGIENQANTALVNTGFEEIGDYDADGPLTITRRNQVFTKSGQFYSASASLTLPYTTVNNWVSDAPKFVNRGDFVLRQDLGQSTGATLVGAVDGDGNATTVQAELLKNKSDFLLVDSVASARLVPASFKGVIGTTGYYAGSTDGGAMYRIDLSDTTSADNSFTTLVSVGGVRRKIVYQDKLTVKQAGAKGDYTKLSNTGTDDAVALQRAHDLAPKGVTVFYELGLYFTTQRIYWNGGSSVVFASRATATDAAYCAIVGALALDGVVESRIGDSTFSTKVENAVITRQTGSTSNSVRGLICSGVDQQVFVDCASYHHGICVHVNGQLAPVFERLNTWDTNGAHVKISTCVEPRFINCRFGRNGGADRTSDCYILIDGSGGIQVDTVDFTSCQFNQSGLPTNSVIRIINYNNANGIITFTGCHMEAWATYVVNIENTTLRLQRVKFVACTSTSDTRQQFVGGNVSVLEDLQITSCTLAVTLTFDQVNSASLNSSHLDGPLVINAGKTIIGFNRLVGAVTLTGSTGKLTLMGNQFGGSVSDSFTGTRSVSGNI